MFWQEDGMAMATRRLAAAIVALLPLLLADLSQAAGRVFYDGFESGNTSLWKVEDGRNGCRVVTSSVDGITGAYAGRYFLRSNSDGTVGWDTPAAFETLFIDSVPYTNELFYRFHIRLDSDFSKGTKSPGKLLRIYTKVNAYNDLYESTYEAPGLQVGLDSVGGSSLQFQYWGGSNGDNTARSSSWHKVEYYFNAATGKIRVWHDGVMVMDETAAPGYGGAKMYPLYLQSNFSDPHDASNHVYYDEIEVFSDNGSSASGSMADASVSASGISEPNPPSAVSVQ